MNFKIYCFHIVILISFLILHSNNAKSKPFTTNYNIPDTQLVVLANGWNLFSTYIDPIYPQMDSIFVPIINNLELAKDNGGNVFWPQWSINNIGDHEIGQGYQLKMNAGDTLTIYGSEVVPEQTPIYVYSGWNMVAYLRQISGIIDTMLTEISANVYIVKNGLGLIYWPLYNINNIGNMNPGEAYQIKMQNDDTLFYPANYVNLPPTAIADYAQVLAGESASIFPLANDIDPENDLNIAASIIGTPSAGSASFSTSTGELIYTAENTSGAVEIAYTIVDNNEQTSNSTIYIEVLANQNLIQLINDSLTITAGTNGQINLATNDIVPEGISLVELLSNPNNGSASLDSMGLLNFSSSVIGLDSAIYQMTDNAGNTNNAMIYFNVEAIPYSGTNFIFKDVAMDTVLSNGLCTFKYKLTSASQFTEITTTNGQITLNNLIPGEEYQFELNHEDDLEHSFGQSESLYTFAKRPGDKQAFEQESYEDLMLSFVLQSTDTLIYLSKMMDQGDFMTMNAHAINYIGNTNGIRKFTDPNTPIWIDTTYNDAVCPTNAQLAELDSAIAALKNVENCYLELPIIMGGQEPAGPHIKMQFSANNPSPGSNTYTYNPTTFENIQGLVLYPLTPIADAIQQELFESLGFKDLGGSPPFTISTPQGPELSHTGDKMLNLYFTFQPGTQ